VLKYILGNGSKELSKIEGIVYRNEDGEIIVNPPRTFCDLDRLPFPAWDLFDVNKYIEVWNNGRGMSVLTSRGCPYKCHFCTPTGGHRVRFRKISDVLDDIDALIEKYNIDLVGFADECFVLSKKRVLEFCDEKETRNLNFRWMCAGRANITNDEELLKRMKEQGCIHVGYGIESGSQVILDRMEKKFKIREAEEAIKAQVKVGLPFDTSFIIGSPGDNNDTLNETLNFMIRNDMLRYGVCRSPTLFYGRPYPSTPWFEYAKETGRITNEIKIIRQYWENSEKLIANLSDLSDEELIRKRKYIEKQLKMWSWIKHPSKNFILLQNLLLSALGKLKRFCSASKDLTLKRSK
jgi:radical SAM superfamily enzyme YgiQ (UPF0313 family)